ncbi:twin-arginine translocase TatA/TatE family subunit [Paenibacillus lupini]|jgi:sec-independent protein translocase protein TatA|uniref:twin-arginine translocase TatA/TatE family subunit n=1 Tax=Paenibacillus lupini TaxID=1450204 RepID=UPI0014206756|nr:twin-arginine translocase TatA/TatE family subunit [Paenibacillus lupini]NIK26533.1 sec-independent protein translocase protein TatA [Paenibacillus lupini]
MSGIGATGFILLALVALLLFGPNKLPELGRAFGRTLKEFKAGARDMMDDDKDNKRVEVNRTENIESDNKRLPD